MTSHERDILCEYVFFKIGFKAQKIGRLLGQPVPVEPELKKFCLGCRRMVLHAKCRRCQEKAR